MNTLKNTNEDMTMNESWSKQDQQSLVEWFNTPTSIVRISNKKDTMGIEKLTPRELRLLKKYILDRIESYVKMSQFIFENDEPNMQAPEMIEFKNQLEDIDYYLSLGFEENDLERFTEFVLPRLKEMYKVKCFYSENYFTIYKDKGVYNYYPLENKITSGDKVKKISLDEFKKVFSIKKPPM